jgi:predicted Zn finger-like uncharacterized protein
MYSQCPDCQTRFRVTADALRAAHGTVRCGRCGSAFDALPRLSDTIPPAGSAMPTATLVGSTPESLRPGASAPAAEYHFSADDLEKVFVDARDWQRQYGATTAETPEASGPGNEPSELLVDETESREDITLEGERIQIEVPPGFDDDEAVLETVSQEAKHDLDSTDRFEVLRGVPESAWVDDVEDAERAAAEIAETADLADAIKPGEEIAAAAVMPAAVARAVAAAAPVATKTFDSIEPRRWRAPIREAHDEALPIGRRADDEEAEAPRRVGLAWALGSLVLALALVAQLTHYFRQELVKHPQIGPALGTIYGRLGLALEPNWDPRAFEIRQWGGAGASPAAGRMSVQASITNKATFAQPLPLLRLELEDRFGAPVATRDFEPAEYLKSPAVATRMLGAGASAEADLEIVDPGADAVGYRLDVCLRESAELLRCAQGAG